MKAYQVTDQGPDAGACVVFAEHAVVARRQGAQELDCEFESVSCARAPDFDAYALLGYVPADVLVDHGWFIFCQRCEARVDGDNDHDLVVEGRNQWCSPQCRERDARERARREAKRSAGRADFCARFPGATVKSVIVGGASGDDVTVRFTFPGAQGQGEFRASDPAHIRVERRDLEAWQQWREPMEVHRD